MSGTDDAFAATLMAVKTHTLLIAMCLALLLTGCAGVQPPVLRPAGITHTTESDDAIVVTCSIDAVNPNDVLLPLVELYYHAEMDGRTVYTGRRAVRQTLTAGGTYRLDVPIVITFSDAADRPIGMHQLALSGELTYIAPGRFTEALFDIGIHRPKVSLRVHETVDLSRDAAEVAPR